MHDDQSTPVPTAGASPGEPVRRRKRMRAVGSAVAIGAAGVVAGGIVAGTLSANAEGAASGTAPAAYGDAGGHGNGNTDPSRPMRSDEKLLTGTTKAKVLAAVKAKYPDATIQRVETDSDGVYEAHVLDNGTPVIVQVGKDFTVTGTQTGGPGGGRAATTTVAAPAGPRRPRSRYSRGSWRGGEVGPSACGSWPSASSPSSGAPAHAAAPPPEPAPALVGTASPPMIVSSSS